MPGCTQILTKKQCAYNANYRRDANFSKNIKPIVSLISINDYLHYTFSTFTTNQFDLFTHKYLHANDNIKVIIPTLFFIGILLAIHYSENKKLHSVLIFIISLYFLTLFSVIYRGYLNTGQRGIAVQGRYLFPIIIPTYYLIAFGYEKLLKYGILKIVWVL